MKRALPLVALILASFSRAVPAAAGPSVGSSYCQIHPSAPSCQKGPNPQCIDHPETCRQNTGGPPLGGYDPNGGGTGNIFAPPPGSQNLQECMKNPACASATLCAVNPTDPRCASNSNSNGSTGGGSAGSTAQSSGISGKAVTTNANWAPEDVAKLQGAGQASPAEPAVAGGTALPGAQRTQLASPLAFPGAMSSKPLGSTPANIAGGFDRSAPDRKAQARDFIGSAANKLKLGDFGGALRDSLHAIALDPDNPAGYLRAAEAYNHMGQYADAERMSREAIARDPNNAQTWKNLAWALLKQGKYEEALQAALKAIQLKPDMAEAWAIAAYAAERLKDLAARDKYLQKAAELDGRFKDKLDAAKNGANIYSDEDDDSLFADMKARAKGVKLPWETLGGGLAALAAGGVGFGLWKRRRGAAAAPQRTLVQLRPPTPAAPRAPQFVAPSGAGEVVGKYELGSVIGRGGMGEVFEATDLSLGRKVAIKKMTAGFSELGGQARALFLKEARTVAQLHHPAIVDIYEILDHKGDLYLVFEHVKGKTAQHLIAERRRLSLAEAAGILQPVCEALDFAHGRSLVHRDLKPANIMLTEQGHVKLMDFGIARSLADAEKATLVASAVSRAQAALSARTATVVGTPAYMAPESETGVVCKEGDVYSLGVSLYEMVTGRLPFTAEGMPQEKASLSFAKASQLVPELPKPIDDLIAKALQPAAADRLKTPGEFYRLLWAARG